MDIVPDAAIDWETCYQIVHDELFPLCVANDELIGVETEMFVLQHTSSVPAVVPFFQTGGKGLRTILHELAQQEGWSDDYCGDEHLSAAALSITIDNGDRITFEPGGQIEYSSRPHTDLHTLLMHSSALQEKLRAHLAQHSMLLLQLGINPWHTLDEIGLQIPKHAYRLLDDHFSNFSPIGKRMMRQACTQQISLDCGSSETMLAKRYLVCNLLAPYVAAMFANSGVWERNRMQMQGFRTRIWRELDNSRTGFPDLHAVERHYDRATCARTYLDYALQALIVRRGNDQQQRVCFRQWLDRGIAGVRPTVADFRQHLYTLYPEVRPRGYFELRSVDCQSSPWQSVPVAFYLGIVYHVPHLDLVLDALLPELGQQEQLMHSACYGLEHSDKQFRQRLHWLVDLAIAGLAVLPARLQCKGAEQRLQLFCEHFTLQNKTPAADIQILVQNNDQGYLCPEQLLQLETKWAALFAV